MEWLRLLDSFGFSEIDDGEDRWLPAGSYLVDGLQVSTGCTVGTGA